MIPQQPINNQTVALSQAWNTQQLEGTYSMQGCAYLTPDALMAYCQSRLQGLDTQVNQAFAQQQSANQASSVLSKILSDPRFSIPDDTLSDGAAAAKLNDAEGAIREQLKNLDPKSAAYQELVKVANDIKGLPHDKLSATTFQNSVVNAVNNVQKDINSSSELSMIGLQSLVSQRPEAIQVCTNLVQSLGDQVNKIAENVGK